MRKLMVGAVVIGSLLLPAAAGAGGWATAGIDPPAPPEGSGPGDAWTTHITVLQHGVTPLAGVRPVVILTDRETGRKLEYPARPTGKTGVYVVRVKLPAEGTYDLSVYDGFAAYGGAQTHTFAPITIGQTSAPPVGATEKPGPAPAADAEDGSIAVWPLALGALVAALAAAGVVLGRRNRKKAPAAV